MGAAIAAPYFFGFMQIRLKSRLMARFWKQANHGRRFGDRTRELQPHYARTLEPPQEFCITVCSFTFRFDSRDDIQEYIGWFEQRTHPSSRLPVPEGADRFDRWHMQRWYERLPMYLQEEPKREKVLKALRKAVALIDSGKF